MAAVEPTNKHLDGQNIAELRNFKINPVPTDPTGAALDTAIMYWVMDVKKWKYYDGTELKIFGEENGRKRGNFDASSGAIPTAADATVDVGSDLISGDFFVVTVAGTIAGLPGTEELEVGDLLYASIDSPAAAADFHSVQTNITLADKPLEVEVFLAQDILAATPLTVTPSQFTVVSGVEIIDGNTGERLTDSLAITYDAGLTGDFESVTIETLVDIQAATVKLRGYSS